MWKPRIREFEYAVRNPGRYVITPDNWHQWSLYLGKTYLDQYPTIPEAMDAAYAHAEARALAAHFTIPPETEPTC